MDIAIQIIFILHSLLMVGTGFAAIGKEVNAPNRYSYMGVQAFLAGAYTIAIMIWWDTSGWVELAAKVALLVVIWAPWVYQLPDIHKPFPSVTLGRATAQLMLSAARIGIVVGFWIL